MIRPKPMPLVEPVLSYQAGLDAQKEFTRFAEINILMASLLLHIKLGEYQQKLHTPSLTALTMEVDWPAKFPPESKKNNNICHC